MGAPETADVFDRMVGQALGRLPSVTRAAN
jgi:hypothetical protein